jgi:hypothetical protein
LFGRLGPLAVELPEVAIACTTARAPGSSWRTGCATPALRVVMDGQPKESDTELAGDDQQRGLDAAADRGARRVPAGPARHAPVGAAREAAGQR